MTQAALAEAVGRSPDTIVSWELGRRTPGEANVAALVRVLALTPAEVAAATGEPPEAAGLVPARLATLELHRLAAEDRQAELDSYPWPCLSTNEEFEVVAWNQAANVFAEFDFGRDLPLPWQRQLLRLMMHPHFRPRLINWEEVAAYLVALYRMDRVDDATPSPYFQTLVAELAREHNDRFARIANLWAQPPPFAIGARVAFQARWRTGDGTPLLINCVTSALSDFDAASAFDWHPADAASWEWLEKRQTDGDPAPPPPAAAPPPPRWNEVLAWSREHLRLSQEALAERAGISRDTVYSYETGRRQPTRSTLLRIMRAMELGAVTTNRVLEAAGFEPEPSDWSLVVSGLPARSQPGHYPYVPTSTERPLEEVQAQTAAHPWPSMVVNNVCEVVAANGPLTRALGFDPLANPPGVERSLVNYITSPRFRESAANWRQVATSVLPGSLERYFQGVATLDKPSYFREVVEHLRRKDERVLHELFDAWQRAPRRRLAARISFPVDWRAGARGLRFNCIISPWGPFNAHWAIDWHPADAATWDWLEGQDTRAERPGSAPSTA